MSKKMTDELRMEIRDEFVHGYPNDEGAMAYPSIDQLYQRHDVSRPTLYRAAKREDWQKQKNQYQSELQAKQDQERLEAMLKSGKRLDDNALAIAQAMLTRIGRRLQRAIKLEQDSPTNQDGSERVWMTSVEFKDLSIVAANAQKVGKLALGEATDISKVSADVTNPEAFRAVMEQLDELAEAKSRQSNEPVH